MNTLIADRIPQPTDFEHPISGYLGKVCPVATQLQTYGPESEFHFYKVTAKEADEPCLLRGAHRVTAIPSLAMERGILIHRILESFNRAILRSGVMPDVDWHLARAWSPTYYPGTLEAVGTYDRARASLVGYRDFLTQTGLHVEVAEVHLQTRPQHLATIPRLGVQLVGRVDVLLRRGDNTLVVLDFKTGSYLPSENELMAQPSSTVYTLLVKRHYPSTPTIEVMQLQPHTGILVSSVLDEGTMEVSREAIRHLVVAKHEGTYPPTPGPYCGHCPVLGSCPAHHQRDTGEQLTLF